jgi:hypothetical protein
MRVRKGHHYAVLTGDIVRSSRLSVAERKAVGRLLDRAGQTLARWSTVPLPLSRHRGDGWQVLLADPAPALRAALLVRATLRAGGSSRSLDTRIGIGVGTVEFVPGDRLEEGDGPAYRLSGSALEEKGTRRLRWAAESSAPADADPPGNGPRGAPARDDRPDGEAVPVVLDLVDFLVQEWTPAQATAVLGALEGWKQEKIAAKWPGSAISQQGVAQHLRRAGWDVIDSALRWYEARFQA